MSEDNGHQSRMNELGSEFRKHYITVSTGLLLGILFKGGGTPWTAVFVGIGVCIVLGNILWSKHRSDTKRMNARDTEVGTADRMKGWVGSVSFVDGVALLFLIVGFLSLAC